MASSSSRRTKAVGGDSIGQFVIDQEIGKGSFAQVYAGKHKVSTAVALSQSPKVSPAPSDSMHHRCLFSAFHVAEEKTELQT